MTHVAAHCSLFRPPAKAGDLRSLILRTLIAVVLVCCAAVSAQAQWATQSTNTPPSGRQYASAASQPFTNRSATTIVFGGFDGTNYLGDTWYYANGGTWQNLGVLSPGPSPRAGAAMVFDAAGSVNGSNGTLLLFGGVSSSGYLNDTWMFDYITLTWTKINTAHSPSAREFASISAGALKTLGGFGLVLFGGIDSTGVQNDTWMFTGTDWVKQSPSTSPPARVGQGMVNLDNIQLTVLYGGKSATNQILSDTWLYDGTTWTQQSPVHSPGPLDFFGLAYDANKFHAVLFGGNNGTTPYGSETYTYDGFDWQPLVSNTSPPGRNGAVFVYQTGTGEELVFSGLENSGSGPVLAQDTWLLNLPQTPTVTALSSTSGSAAGGGTITIYGTNLSTPYSTSSVHFGSTTATNVHVTGTTSITATIPPGTGTEDITVTQYYGTSPTSSADQYTYYGAPTVSSISPTSGPPAGGTTVTINGSNLTSTTGVSFGAAAATNVSVVNNSQVTASSPAGTGSVDVTVTTGGGTSATSSADKFTYLASQTITFAPTSPVTYGVSPITLSATATSNLPVTFSYVSGPGTLSGSTLTVTGVGTIVINANQVGNGSYSAAPPVQANIVVSPASLTLTAGSYSGVYDGSSHSISACTVSTNPDGITCTNSLATVGPDVGSGVITPTAVGSTSNYTVTSNNGSWSITAKPVTLTAGSYSGAYDGISHTPSACASSTPGVTCSNSLASVGPGVGSGTISPVASYTTGNASDYTITPANGSYSITKLAASVTPNANGKIYGATDPTLTGTLAGFLPGDSVSATYSRTPGESVASSPYTISAALSPSGVLGNYTITYNTAPFTIGKASQTITFTPTSTVTYGVSPLTLTATGGASGNPVTFSYVSGPASLNGSILTVTGTGTIVLTADQAGTANFTAATEVQRSITVIQPLTVTAANLTVVAGATPTQYVSQLMASFNALGLTGPQLEAVFASNIEVGFAVSDNGSTYNIPLYSYGTYYGGNLLQQVPADAPTGAFTMTPYITGPGAANFSFTPVAGILTISPPPTTQPLTVTAATLTVYAGSAPTQTIAQLMASYSAPGLTGLQLEQAFSADNIEVGFAVSVGGGTFKIPLFSNGTYYGNNLVPAATGTAPLGTYTMTPYISGTGAANFSFTPIAGSVTIAPAP